MILDFEKVYVIKDGNLYFREASYWTTAIAIAKHYQCFLDAKEVANSIMQCQETRQLSVVAVSIKYTEEKKWEI